MYRPISYDVLKETLRGDPSGERGSTFVKVALCMVGAAGIAGWLFLALVHISDRYKVGHVQGHWMALAKFVNDGTLYPPLSDGARFGGTRHMPLPILLNATAARLTDEYLVSGKAVALALFTALLSLTFLVLRQIRCPAPLALALTGLLPATNTGVLAGSAMGGDVLSVLMQVGALVTASVAVRRDRVQWMMAAGVLAGVAICSKLTGVWATLGVLSWLAVRRDWQRLLYFVTACGATTAITLGIVQSASQGRFSTTFLTLTFAGTGGPASWLRAPNQGIYFAAQDLLAVWMVAPFALLGVLAAWRGSALTLYHHALAWSLVLTLIVFTDVGAGLNQLLDPAVLTIAAVATLAAHVRHERLGAATLQTALALGVIWAGITGVRGLVPDLREAVARVRSGSPSPQVQSSATRRCRASRCYAAG